MPGLEQDGWLQDLTYDWGRFIEYDMQLVFAIGAGQFDLALWMLCFVTVEFYLKVTASLY